MKEKKKFYALWACLITAILFWGCTSGEAPVSSEDDHSKEASTYEFTTEPFEVQLENRSVKGYVYVPQSIQGKLPVIICSHGFGGSYEEIQSICEGAARQGIIGVAFDFYGGSGSSISGGKMEEMTVFTEQEELEAVTDAICKRSDVDSSSVALFGFSQGGFVSTLAACENPDRYCNLFLYAPAYHIPDSMKDSYPDYDQITTSGPEYHCIGEQYAKSVYYFDIYGIMSDYENTVYLYHGNKDEAVPINYSKKAQQTFADCQLQMINNEAHGISDHVAEIICADIARTLH